MVKKVFVSLLQQRKRVTSPRRYDLKHSDAKKRALVERYCNFKEPAGNAAVAAHAAQILSTTTACLAVFRRHWIATIVSKSFNIHDRVSWNSEAGRVSGRITRVHTREFEVKGYTHHASPDDPQYEIKSSKTDHIAFHKGAALTKLGD